MKNLILSLLILISFNLTAQVGIGTTTPNGLLDIAVTNPASPITTDGLLIPRVLAFPTPVGIAQNGMMVFLTTAFSGNKIGLYYYDFPSLTWKWLTTGNNGNVWAFNNANSRIDLPFQSDAITARPAGNEVLILDNGNMGLGIINPIRKLEVSGATRITSSNPLLELNANFASIPNLATFRVRSAGEIVMRSNENNASIPDWEIKYGSGTNATLNDTFYIGRRSNASVSAIDNFLIINNLGNTGIGNTNPITKFDVLGDVNLTTGIYYGGKTSPMNLEIIRPLPVVVNNIVEIGNFNITHGAHNFRITATVSLNQFSVSKTYIVSTAYNQTSGAWQILNPTSNTGIYVLDDFETDINVNNNVTSLRIRRKSGVVAGNISIRIENTGFTTDVFTATTATATATAPTITFGSSVAATSWTTSGNAATTDSANFIGTADNVPLNFRVNNQKSGRVAATGETFFGFEAGKNNTNTANDRNNSAFGYRAFTSNSTTSARDNTAIGQTSLTANNGGSYNTGLGSGSLSANVSGSYNTALGKDALNANSVSYNTAIGWESLVNNSTGTRNIGFGVRTLRYYGTVNDNIAIGYESMVGSNVIANNTGNNNTAIGNFALNANISGTENVTLGNDALKANSTGSQNTAIGYQSLTANTTGTENTSIGRKSMPTNTTGSANTAIGFNALFLNNGNNNTAVGRNTLFFNGAGNNNSALGWNAMFNNKTGVSNTAVGYGASYLNESGSQNTASGERALYNNTASNNSAFGYQAMFNNLAGTFNSALGTNALFTNTSGDYNVAIGNNALNFNLSGSSNTAIGYSALYTNSIGVNNTAMGRNALNINTSNNNSSIGHTSMFKNTTGSNNVAFGYQSLYENVTGINNTAIGTNSLINNLGSNNIGIGYNADVPINSASNQLSIGNVIYGITMSTTALGKIGIGQPNPSEKLDVAGNLKFSGALMPNNIAGTTGQVLVSAGAGVAPIWDSNPVKPYNTTNGLVGVYNINLNQHTIRVFGGISTVNLPSPVGNLGKVFTIIGSNGSGSHTLTTTTGIIYDDIGAGAIITTINQGERITVQSDGTDWIVIGR